MGTLVIGCDLFFLQAKETSSNKKINCNFTRRIDKSFSKTMKIRTFFHLFLLCIALNSAACRSSAPGNTPATVEEAEKQMAKKAKADGKASRREAKKSKKAYWARQSKAARKSVKRNEKNQKKIARQKRKQGNYNYENQERW